MQAWSCGATCTSGSVAKTGTLASALYVIESAADGTRLHAAHTMGQPEPLSASSWGGYGPGTLKLTGP